MDIAKKLAALQNIKLPAENDEQLKKLLTVPDTCTSLNDFLKCFALPDALMMTQEGISEAVYLVAENIRQQGVIYAEIRFAPQNHTEKGMSQEEAVQAALEGLKRTELKANIILCCMRGEGNEEANYETLELTKKYLVEDGGVTGMDLAGAEALYPTSKYAALFAKAREYGIPFTIHAGEAAGAESVRCAIEYGASRIGHGVRIKEDDSVCELVKNKGIVLEMCPTSNRQTHAHTVILILCNFVPDTINLVGIKIRFGDHGQYLSCGNFCHNYRSFVNSQSIVGSLLQIHAEGCIYTIPWVFISTLAVGQFLRL